MKELLFALLHLANLLALFILWGLAITHYLPYIISTTSVLLTGTLIYFTVKAKFNLVKCFFVYILMTINVISCYMILWFIWGGHSKVLT